jgi:hypothetical protein
MIVEMRTYQLRPGTMATFEQRFAEKLPGRVKLSPLAALWKTEVGQLNTVIHVWPYESFEERSRVRAEAVATGVWPPASTDLLTHIQSEVFIPAPFSPKLEPRELGGLYEIRMYEYAPGSIPSVIERWSEKIGERVKLSPLVGAWYSELGGLNKWVHIWAYKDANHRAAVRAEAISKGIWPPTSAPGQLLKQENWLCLPSACSPLR